MIVKSDFVVGQLSEYYIVMDIDAIGITLC